MSNFLISVEYDPVTQGYMACFLNGQVIVLNANNYQDAILEADHLTPEDYEVGYN